MFKRKKAETDEPDLVLEAVPDLPPLPAEPAAEERTTCYPRDGQPPPPVAGQARTTVYRHAVHWNRGGYDNIN